MQDIDESPSELHRRVPWNKGKLTGAKPPLRPKHVWSIRSKLQLGNRARDLAMFNLAIDSKLRGCDVVALKVEDVAPHGHAVDRATVRQKKTGRPVRFELTEPTREAIDAYLRQGSRRPGEFLFPGFQPADQAGGGANGGEIQPFHGANIAPQHLAQTQRRNDGQWRSPPRCRAASR